MHQGPELRWVLEGFTPETIPFARLTEYMTELAKLFGEQDAVRFLRVEDNCVAVVNKVVKPGSLSKIENRLRLVRDSHPVASRNEPYDRINTMLSEDKGRAYIKRGSAIILRFPGLPEPAADEVYIEGVATVSGYLYYLSETRAGEISIRIRQHEKPMARCVAPASLSADLKKLLFSSVRLTGKGQWKRDGDGNWSVTDLLVAKGVEIKDCSVRQAINELRSINASWDDDALLKYDLAEGEDD